MSQPTDRCLNCNEPIEYKTDCADGINRWMHVGRTGDDDPFGPRKTRYRECLPRTVAEPGHMPAVNPTT